MTTFLHCCHRYEREFGFTIPDRPIVVDDIRVRGTAKACSHSPTPLPPAVDPPHREQVCTRHTHPHRPPTQVTSVCYEEGVLETDVYLLSKLTHGHTVSGPAIIIDNNRSVGVVSGCGLVTTIFLSVRYWWSQTVLPRLPCTGTWRYKLAGLQVKRSALSWTLFSCLYSPIVS